MKCNEPYIRCHVRYYIRRAAALRLLLCPFLILFLANSFSLGKASPARIVLVKNARENRINE